MGEKKMRRQKRAERSRELTPGLATDRLFQIEPQPKPTIVLGISAYAADGSDGRKRDMVTFEATTHNAAAHIVIYLDAGHLGSHLTWDEGLRQLHATLAVLTTEAARQNPDLR